MESTSQNMCVPQEFPFPFTPYNIQLDFMKSLYAALKDGKLGIFESPTGTGKSLSIICGGIKWLKDHGENEKMRLAGQIAQLEVEKAKFANEEKDWFTAQSKEIEVSRHLNQLKIEEKKLTDYQKKIEHFKSNSKKINVRQFKSKPVLQQSELADSADKLQVEDEDILLDELGGDEPEDKEEEDDKEQEDKYQPTQLIIASRTHSQLAQFVGEIRKSPFGENVRVVSLASRQNYCINPAVRKLNNMALINERCLDMQKKRQSQSKTDGDGKVVKKAKKPSQCQCPYYKQSPIEDLRDFALSQVQDIEDLLVAGRELNACPYYASRKAAEDAEIVLVPYNTLLHKATREASGINLKDNVVIVDEAHNLLEALAQMYSSDLTYPQLYYGLHSLRCYKQRFNTMFSAATLRYLNQLIFVVNKLSVIFEKDFKEEAAATDIFTLEHFVLSAGIDQYNFFNLVKFCKSSKIAQKVRSYSLKYPITMEPIKKPPAKKGVRDFLTSIGNKEQDQMATEPPPPKFPVPNNPVLAILSFLECLTNSYEDGRILITKSAEKQNCKLQFLLLNPMSNFGQIVQEARSVIVAGGTMKPNAEFRDRLFVGAGADTSRIVEFSCDHIIPAENILPIAVTKGLRQEKLQFNFNNRMLMGGALKEILKRSCEVVKGGIVVFFPSYNYESWVYEQVKSINFGRVLFREPQKTGSVDEVLEKYAATIKKSKNAILFSVVGGKLSEGLNFSDDLGRCVIVVGLPYANITSADLKEKMAFLDKKEGAGAGQQFYENLCMKAVNQCIGRAVRHRNDYATVLLLDERYGRSSVCNALPGWIRRSLKVRESKEAFDLINEFFVGKESIRRS